MVSKVVELKCGVMKYLWGKKGDFSKVAQLQSSGDNDFNVIQDSHYAELWMGVHPNCPSRLSNSETLLSDHLLKYPEFIGKRVLEKYGSLPFLFKVLSVDIALSVQVHPDQDTAKRLHATDPEHYPDPNHKPELAIALTDFKALVAFRPYVDIIASFSENPELRQVFDIGLLSEFEQLVLDDTNRDDNVTSVLTVESMKKCLRSAITADVSVVHRVLKSLENNINEKDEKSEIDSTFLTLCRQHPGDVGCLMVFFLNIVNLTPGQAVYLKAGLPHAYLSGDCIECMACSDNVVRAGLTPKFKDVDCLCDIIDARPPSQSRPVRFDPYVQDSVTLITSFRPDNVPEFAVDRIEIPSNVLSYHLIGVDSGSICLMISGDCKIRPLKYQNVPIKEDPQNELIVKKGSVFFIASDTKIAIYPIFDSSKKREIIDIYRAYCPE